MNARHDTETASTKQYVCPVCGYNMIGACPEHCLFCGAHHDCFLTMEEAQVRYRVEEQPVTERISCVNSVPTIGLEHAAYRIKTLGKTFLIDCPVVFDTRIQPIDVIVFTHPHFLGASNLYRDHFGAEVWIHALDAENPLARPFPFDRKFANAFAESGLEAHPIGGHTPGFPAYIHGDVLLRLRSGVCGKGHDAL
jgi:hypothetical protein